MDISIRHNPAFAVARATLAPNEAIRLESGAMMATSGDVSFEAKLQGGLMGSLKRAALGGESLFMTTFTAGPGGGWVDCAANLPGDVAVRTVSPEAGLNISRGSYLCSESTVNIDTKWGGFKNLFGSEGGFLIHASGVGEVVVSCFGAMEKVVLVAGERLVLDTGHMVAYDPSVQMTLRKASTGIAQTLKSGEGLVFEFTGPGEVWTQSRNPSALVSWLTTALP
ncbi:MAG: hypothetical protein QOE98_651, partial [Gaiellaceae bacterium]|nr:hypothetical protein [Gaiellaceae bacterium]